ncbi:MAG TPA: hypothetical protein VK208_21940 [Pyrinomonadaceae bacterium]|nr:hypothetical protein [Pyrinomonadaceae bacterium]
MKKILQEHAVKVGDRISLTDSAAKLRWAFINSWQVEPQSEDRLPAFGTGAQAVASPPPTRSAVRRKHQQMFKQWSQARHD